MARYTPGVVPQDPQQIPAFLAQELAKIAQAGDTADQFLQLDTLYAAPKKIREGMVVKADGVTWNPGSGAGVYCYRSGWTFLG